MTSHLQKLIEADLSGAVAAQFTAREVESLILPWELADPLGELSHTPVPGLVRKYRNRALLLVTDTCAAHCRYCFRRSSTGRHHGALSTAALGNVLSYLQNNTEIRELLLSGGDPLTLSEQRLKVVTDMVRSVTDIVLRLCTRVPIVSPSLVTPGMISLFRNASPLWMVVQINHRNELSRESRQAFEKLVDAGIPVVSQTVLLRGINDSADTLAQLFDEVLRLRIKPYQLFQADLVPGTAHFRVPLPEGVGIYEKLRTMVSTLALPVYAVDAPGGGGKIPLGRDSLKRKEGDYFMLQGLDGRFYRYPDETGMTGRRH